MTGRRTSYAASLTVAVVLLGLAVATTVGFFAVMQANERVTAARGLVVLHLDLDQAIAAEAAAEAGYRRAPSPEARVAFHRAVGDFEDAVADIPAGRQRSGTPLPSLLNRLNQQYGAEVRRTLDAPPEELTEDVVAGPALRSMQELVLDEVSMHRGRSIAATEAQRIILRWLAIVLPAVFLLAFALLGFVLRRMLADQRRLRVEAAHSRTLAQTDFLTGLSNRSHLEVVMNDVLGAPHTTGALLYLDLDRFKPVNDLLGHHAGDIVLVEIARRLQESVRAGATVARIGGDEFAVVLPGCQTPDQVAARIAEAVEAPIQIGDEQVSVGTSIGIAAFPDVAGDLAGLLAAADAALYQAKRTGRRRVGRARRPEPAVAAQPGPAPAALTEVRLVDCS